ncbi:hypothetical protein [Methylobacterium nigriterrae]|uniref:hypothetical protein n=1 Tax=Methylobacterium nigriterrae TaxID=3127512 RepID=UPI0030141780
MTLSASHPFSVLVSPCGSSDGGHVYIWTIIENGQPMAHSPVTHPSFEEACRAAKAKLET